MIKYSVSRYITKPACVCCSDRLCQSEAADQRLLGTWWWRRVDSRMSIELSLVAPRLSGQRLARRLRQLLRWRSYSNKRYFM